jgi:hypothetical protein
MPRSGCSTILKDVAKIAKEKSERTKRVFRELLSNCTDLIRRAAEQSQMHVLYSVPPVRIGLPAYDVDEARSYVRDKLRSKGFDVRNEAGHELFIDWKEAIDRAETRSSKKRKKRAHRPKRERPQVPPREMDLPDLCKDPNDIFALPSLRAVRATVARLK